jgi:DNA (cytosine-5)-methyltransferase 1
MTAYYNEIDPFAAEWLRNLIKAGLIAKGDVDERSIVEVTAGDVSGYTQCHFFAGIGGWSHALRLAGWDHSRPVWTGSCPCQSFSAAGKQQGFADARHLWPHWFRLIKESKPEVVFGEQVEAAIRHGWLDLVQSDLEGEGYSVGAAVLGAHSVGGAHIRQRLYFGGVRDRVAHPAGAQAYEELQRFSKDEGRRCADSTGRCSLAESGMAYSNGRYSSPEREQRGGEYGFVEEDGGVGWGLADAQHFQRRAEFQINANSHGRDGFGRGGDISNKECGDGGLENSQLPSGKRLGQHGGEGLRIEEATGSPRPSGFRGGWGDIEWLHCRDSKYRPTQSGLFPLAHGVSGRVGRLRAYGNAIVPQVAAEFIQAWGECRP